MGRCGVAAVEWVATPTLLSAPVLLAGHSTGGLVCSLYAHEGELRDQVDALWLNSAFFDWRLADWKRPQLHLAAAIGRGHEVYIHTNCQPLSFDFTLREPYILYSHDAFDRVKAAAPEDRAGIYRDAAFRQRLRESPGSPST